MPIPPNLENRNLKRKDYLNWDEFFMAATLLTAQRQTVKPQLASIIVDDNQTMIKEAYATPTEHSEVRVLSNLRKEYLENAMTMYTIDFPCRNCAKLITETNIKTLVYLHDCDNSEEQEEVRRFLQTNEIITRKFQTKLKKIELNFENKSS